uniref:C2H2-type domain-containing protein n=1 Tax=Anopheles epiroticus TaxID=199890 RepID=A0A182P9Q2_9DIPT
MCNNAHSLLKSFLTTGVWPNQLTLPKEVASVLPNLKQSVSSAKTAVSNSQPGEAVKDTPKAVNIIKLSPSDLKNFKQGQKINSTNRIIQRAENTAIGSGEEANESTRMPLMTSTPIVKRQGSDLKRTGEPVKPAPPDQHQNKGIKDQKVINQEHTGSKVSGNSGAPNTPFILNQLVQSTVPEVKEEFVSTGDGTVEMVVSYVPDPNPQSNDNVFPCIECAKTYPLKQLLDIHQLSHRRERKHVCDHCEKRFYSKYDLSKHLATHTGERPYVCVICRAAFSRSNLLIRHQARHHDQPKHVCTQCERPFLTQEDLNKHMENHEKNRPFKCSKCPKSFAYKQGLERHEVVHMEKLPFQCEYCDQSYLTAGKLSRHLTSHAGDRPYPCRLCNKSFLLSHHLSRHLRRHNATGQSEYKCCDCGALFNSLGDLVYHSAKHAMQSLMCPLCREPFDNVDKVTEHIQSHSEQTHYACDYCDMMYTSEKKLGDHCTQKHANELAYELPNGMYAQMVEGEQEEEGAENGTEGDNFVMDYEQIQEEEIIEGELYMDEDIVPSQKRGPGRPPKAKPAISDAKVEVKQAEKSSPKQDVPKVAQPATGLPKRSIVPAKNDKVPVEVRKEPLKRSASAAVISKERKTVIGQENATTTIAKGVAAAAPAARTAAVVQSKSSDSQSWMIKRSYLPKGQPQQPSVAKKRPAEQNDEEQDAEEAAPSSKRPALSRKTLNPSMLRAMNNNKEPNGKPNVPASRASAVVKPVSSNTTPAAAATAAVTKNVKNIPKTERAPVEVTIGGKTIKVHKLTKEEAIARANQAKLKQ